MVLELSMSCIAILWQLVYDGGRFYLLTNESTMVALFILGILLGLIFAWRAADRVVVHALRLARHYNVSTFFVGFVFLAMAANIPELAVVVVAGLQGVGQIAAGDIIGSCFTDIALVVGLALTFAGSVVIKRQEALSFLRLIVCAAVVMAGVFAIGSLTAVHGLLLIGIYITFVVWAWRSRHEHTLLEVTHDDLDHKKLLPFKGLMFVWAKAGGALALVLSGSVLSIHCGVALANFFGLSLESVGATIIAFGTTMPEVSMGFHAYRRGQISLALGPAIGTVFSQATILLGVLSVISPRAIDLNALHGAAVFMFIAFLIIAVSILLNRIGRLTGMALLGLFVSYLLYFVLW